MLQIHLAEKSPTAFEGTRKIKSPQAFAASYNHNFRKGDTPANAANERSYLNEEIIALEGKDYNQAFKDRISEEGIQPRKNSVLGLEVTLVAQNTDDDFELSEWKKKSAEWLKGYFGDKNVVSAVYHGDESRPHIHAMIIPIVDGKLRCYQFTNGKEKLAEMQTSYAESVKDLGLERGMENTPVSYAKMQKLRAATGKVADETLPPPNPGETPAEYYTRANETYSESRLSYFRKHNETITQAEKEIEAIRREARADVEKAQESVKVVEERFKELEATVKPLVDENATLKKQVDDFKQKLEEEKAMFARHLGGGISSEDVKRGITLTQAIKAFKEGLLGEENDQKKLIAFTILDQAVAAYQKVHREQDLMADRELGEDDIDITDITE